MNWFEKLNDLCVRYWGESESTMTALQKGNSAYYSNEGHWKAVEADQTNVFGVPASEYQSEMEHLWEQERELIARRERLAQENQHAREAADRLLEYTKRRAMMRLASHNRNLQSQPVQKSA